MAVTEFQATLVESREIAPEVRHFAFETPEPFAFRAGQFVTVRADIAGRPVKRAYSLASAPAGNRFDLCLNRVREGIFSPYLFDLRPGETVAAKGPYGVFTWREPARDTLLVATGTGIAPFRGMLQWRLPRDCEHNITLLFGVRHEHGILYRGEFEAMQRRFPHFRFAPTLTRPERPWTGLTGRVQTHLEEMLAGRRDLEVYLCGLWEMVAEARAMLTDLGVDRRLIVAERYD